MFAISLILASSAADAGCGRITVVDDPLDGRSIGYHQSFDRHRVTGLTLNYVQGAWTMRVYVAEGGISDKRGDKRQRARFVVGDRVVELQAAGRAWPVTGVRPKTGIYTQWRVDFALSDDMITALADDRISVVGLSIADLEHRFELSRGGGNRLHEAMLCAMYEADVPTERIAAK